MPPKKACPQVTTEPSSRRAPNAWFVDWMSETLFSCDWTLLLSPPYSGVPQQTTDPSLRIAANALSVDWIFVTSPEVETNFPDLSCQIYVILNQSAPMKNNRRTEHCRANTIFQDLPSSIDPVLHDCLHHRRNCPRSPLCRQNGLMCARPTGYHLQEAGCAMANAESPSFSTSPRKEFGCRHLPPEVSLRKPRVSNMFR